MLILYGIDWISSTCSGYDSKNEVVSFSSENIDKACSPWAMHIAAIYSACLISSLVVCFNVFISIR